MAGGAVVNLGLKFQSAPDGEVGGDIAGLARPRVPPGFNQPPTVRSGETSPSRMTG